MEMTKILVVDDDPLLRQSLEFNLEEAGYQVRTAANARQALAQIEIERPDLILLDVGLPDMDGLSLLRLLRDRFPVIFLTARRHELDEVLGLELGAEDYITKPFHKEVLLTRIRMVLRRTQRPRPASGDSRAIIAGDLELDPEAHTVTLRGQPVTLSPLEFRLLHLLMKAPNRVFSVDELLNQVWGEHYMGEPQIIYVYMRELRNKLEADPGHPRRIVNVRGAGYKLIPQDP